MKIPARSVTLVATASVAAALVAGGAVRSSSSDRAPDASEGARTPVEVGSANWGRDYDAALAEAGRTGKPVFAFFQEVPGCTGCKTFGRTVMTHPAIVAAVEESFVPLLIYNNRPGRDAEILEAYGEPAWNFQVVRFLDAEGRDLIPRKDRVWTVEALVPRMIAALERAGRPAPRYLVAAAVELDRPRIAEASFSQACFWTGERLLGAVPGVVGTEAGWLDGHEVTRVRYHRDRVSLEELVRHAAASGAADAVYLDEGDDRGRARAVGSSLEVREPSSRYRKASASDQKRQIAGTPFAALELSPMQRTKVNAFARTDLDAALGWLTPDQRAAFVRASEGS